MAGKKVLIVEDTKLFLDMETSFLKREEFSIQGTHSGADAIRIAKSIKPDLVILDHHLPDMNGDLVCRVIRTDPELRATKVIVVTGDDSKATLELYAGMGCDAILNKPFTKGEINSAVEKVLGTNIRQVRRANTEIPCIVRVDGEGYICRILNISVAGIYIEIDFLPEPGRKIEVEFTVPPSISPVQLEAVVKWTSEMVERDIPRGVGVEFIELPDDVREIINDHVENILQGGESLPVENVWHTCNTMLGNCCAYNTCYWRSQSGLLSEISFLFPFDRDHPISIPRITSFTPFLNYPLQTVGCEISPKITIGHIRRRIGCRAFAEHMDIDPSAT